MFKKILLVFLIHTAVFSQEITISGFVRDSLSRSIERASVLILNKDRNTSAYTYSDQKGFFEIQFFRIEGQEYKLIISELGFEKKEVPLDVLKKNIALTIVLKEKTEILKSVIVDYKPVRTEGDTTTIKTAKFVNQTEQTVEDLLKKIPGIEVQSDGSIKAHGKYISKLLLEGDDIFDKNYKLLSKNLDAKVLDAVQILDNYDDNPILKKMLKSDNVSINLRLKDNKKNIWFGNINLGAGVFSENRWKEGVNLGLLKKKIKLFYFSDYNNSGEKATDLMIESTNSSSFFGQDKFEKKTQSFFKINSNENTTFSKSQSIFNNAILNSLSFTTKIKPNFSIRCQGFFTHDNQNQGSYFETKYNVVPSEVIFKESNNYNSSKTLASIELELKYFLNEKNYLTNFFIFNNNPSQIFSNINFNNDQIAQSSKIEDRSFYNHFYYTHKINAKYVLNNYIYFGSNKVKDGNQITSPFLNTFLDVDDNSIINQKFDNSLLYFGVKTKLISTYKKINYVLDFNYENNQEILNNNFLINDIKSYEYENKIKQKQNIISIGNSFRYYFSKKLFITPSLNLTYNNFEIYSKRENVFLWNPQVSIDFKKDVFGQLTVSFSKNSKLAEINYLTNNYFLNTYNGFIKGNGFEKPTENFIISLDHIFLNDQKRFSVNTKFSYLNVIKNFTPESTINQNFSFSNYRLNMGGVSYIFYVNYINYFRALKTSLKIETNQVFSNNPTKVNSTEFIDLKSHTSSYKLSGTSYFTIPFNFYYGISYNTYQSKFNTVISNVVNKEAFLNLNYKFSKSLMTEFNSAFYHLDGVYYSFLNAVINFTPSNSKLSYRLVCNNISNQRTFKTTTLDNYISSTSSIKLIPRYLLLNIKYRF